MQKSVCIIDLSTTEIQIGILNEKQFKIISPPLPWKVGFRQETDDTLDACFGEAFERLDPDHPAEVQFQDLDVKLKDITDEKIMQYLFQAFFEEIFHKQLPEHGYPLVYLITPYRWTLTHRQQLRIALKSVKSDTQVSFPHPIKSDASRCAQPNSMSFGILSKIVTDIVTDVNKCHLSIIDFERDDCTVYHTICNQVEENVIVELCDILRFTDFAVDIDKKILDVQKTLQKFEDDLPIVVSFSGEFNAEAKTIIESLLARCNVTPLEPQENATLLGGAELVCQFEKKNRKKTLYFVYHFCFGVQLPDGKKVEFVPKHGHHPITVKRSFDSQAPLKNLMSSSTAVYPLQITAMSTISQRSRLICLRIESTH